MTKIISVFNNKGGVGKTSILWNLGISLADKDKKVLLIDFDPQCNLSIATLGEKEFAALLNDTYTPNFQYGKTIKSFVLPYVQRNTIGNVFKTKTKFSFGNQQLDIIPGDFWLNSFADILSVGNDVISGSGLYRFLIPELLTKYSEIEYDYVLIDLPPSFNTLVRSALYCSDYFLVPCTPDLFSAYCVNLIGEVLPSFIQDWEQGKQRFIKADPNDELILQKGKPKFGGWVFNGFDTRNNVEVGADKALLETIEKSIRDNLIPSLQRDISTYQAIPDFVTHNPVAKIEDLNVMTSDSIYQNIPIKYLPQTKPTRDLRNRRTWASNQIALMKKMGDEFDKLADYIITNY